MSTSAELQEITECPKCGKTSLVQRSRDRYHCLWCGFNRDLSEPSSGTGLMVILGVMLMILLL